MRRDNQGNDPNRDHRDARTIGGQKLAAVIIPFLIGLGLIAVGIFGLGRESAQDGDGDGILDDIEDSLDAATRGAGALTALVLAGGAVFLATKFLKE